MQLDYFKDPEPFEIAETYKNMGIKFLKMGDRQKAQENLEKALNIQ